MARWFVTRDGSEHGPLDDGELKRAAAAGKIRPDDSVRREDTTTSRLAKEIKGLTFASDLDSRLITADDDFESIDPFNLKSVSPETGIAACLEQKEKIQNHLLPHAYAALGKRYYEAIDHSAAGKGTPPEIAPFVEQIDSLLLEAPSPSGAGTQSSTDPARAKAVENRLVKKYAQLGKRLYEVGGISPDLGKEFNAIQDLVQRDKLLAERVNVLRVEAKKKRESDELADQFRRAKKTAGAVVDTVKDTSVSVIYSTPVLVLLATLIPPLGLWLIWLHPTWGVKSKIQWAGLSLACFLSLLMANHLRTAFQNATEATQTAKNWALEQANTVPGLKDFAPEPERVPQGRPPALPPSVAAAPTPPASQVATAPVPATPPAVSPVANTGNQWQQGAMEFQGHLYKVFPEVMTWVAAKQKCEAMGGHLAVLDTPGKAAFLRDVSSRSGIAFKDMDGIWVGATDKEKEGEWRWVNGQPMTHAEWGPGQPNNKNNDEHYAMVFVAKWQWSDQPLNSTQHTTYFACEWDSGPSLTPSGASSSRPLFNGNDLTGWLVLTHKSTKSGNGDAWSVDPARKVLRSNGGNWVDLQSQETFDDFTMSCEWRFVPGQSVSPNGSGIVVRSNGLNAAGLDPAGIEINLKNDQPSDDERSRCGGLIAYDMPVENHSGKTGGRLGAGQPPRNLSNTRPATLVPQGEWNTTQVECRGDRLKATINGVVVNEAWGIPPTRGHICLRNQNSTVEFRNISIQSGAALASSSAPPAPQSVPASPLPTSAISMIQQSDLTGWRPHDQGNSGCWVVRDGVLIEQCAGTSLLTERTFYNFDMHVEFSLPPKANSGIYLRGRYEVQLLDSSYRDDKGQPAPMIGSTGAIWKLIPPTHIPYKGPNQWNSLDVTLIGKEVTVKLNGETVIDRKTIPGVTGGALDNNEGNPGPFLIHRHLNGDIGVQFRNFTVTPR